MESNICKNDYNNETGNRDLWKDWDLPDHSRTEIEHKEEENWENLLTLDEFQWKPPINTGVKTYKG